MEEGFARGNSLLHKRSPKVKVVATASLLTVVAISSSFEAIAFALGVLLPLVVLSRLPLKQVVRRLAIANTFTLFLWCTLPLTYGGEDHIQFAHIILSGGGVRLAALITLKTNTILLTIILLLGTSSIAELGHGLQGLGIPKKLCFLLLFSYRYIFVIYEEYNRLRRAAMMRCFRPATTLHTYRTFGYLFGMTLIRSINRSRRVYQAMQLRGFKGQLIPLRQSEINMGDKYFLMLFLLLSGSVAWLSFLIP